MFDAQAPIPQVGSRRQPQPTLYDVAADAGVSAMSVSRVLNGGPHVSNDVRRRVMRSVERLGYRRNENARSLRRQQTGLVGLIVTNIDNPYYAQVLLGIEDGLDGLGYRILVGVSHGHIEREKTLVRDFVGRQVEGLVVVPCGGDEAFLNPDQVGGIPVVLASREQPAIAADSVAIEDFEGARLGTSELISRGHTRIGFLGNALSVSTSERRFGGYCQAHREAGFEVNPELVRRTCQDVATSRSAATELLQLETPPSAILCANNQVSMGALEILVPFHRKRPETPPIEIVGIDSFEMVDIIDYPITIIDHDARALGHAAARLLQQRMTSSGTDVPRMRLLLPTSLRHTKL